MIPPPVTAGSSRFAVPDDVNGSASGEGCPVLPGSPRAPLTRRWPGPPIGDPNRLNATYWLARWWVVRHLGLRGRLMIYRAVVAEGTCRDLREAVIAMQEKWRCDRVELARVEAKLWHNAQHRKYQRHLRRISEIVHSAGGPCAYCGDPNPRTIDHVDPFQPRGGPSEIDNLVRCCRLCNSEKGARTPSQWKRARRADGLAWPPQPSEQRPHLPAQASPFKVTSAQMRVLTQLSGAGPAPLGSAHPKTLESMKRYGFIRHRADDSCFEITDRGRVALATGRIPR